MKKIIVLLSLLLGSIALIAQPVSQRGTTAVTVQDARLFAQYNFRPPAFPDTIQANLQIGLDSCGALIFSRDINAYYYRACNPKRWVRVSSGGSITDSAYLSYRPLTDSTFLLCRVGGIRCDTIKINGKGVSTAWLIGGNVNPAPPNLGTISTTDVNVITNNVARMKIAGNGINRSAATRNRYLMIDTSTRYLFYGDATGTDTLAYHSSTMLNDSTIIICKSVGKCDTLVIGNSIINNIVNYQTRLISGSAVWDSLLIYSVTTCDYYINGVFYTSSPTNVTLTTADPTYPRIDVIYCDTAGNVGVITGTPAPNPVKPTVNPLSQIELTHIDIYAGATSPANTSKGIIYNENLGVPSEWNTSTASACGINFNYTTNPYVGTKSIFSPYCASSYEMNFTNNVNVSADTITTLSMYLRLNSAPSVTYVRARDGSITENPLFIVYLLKAGNPVTSVIGVVNNNYGYDRNDTLIYQHLAIPMSDFVFYNPADKSFDEILIYVGVFAAPKLGMQFDYMTFVTGSNPPPTISNYWSLNGNDISSTPNSILGTTSNNSLSIVTNNIERINITDSGAIIIDSLGNSQDTTTYKPIAINSSGEIIKMNNWKGGGGVTPNLQQVTDVGNTTNNSISLIKNIYTNQYLNLFIDSLTDNCYFEMSDSIGNLIKLSSVNSTSGNPASSIDFFDGYYHQRLIQTQNSNSLDLYFPSSPNGNDTIATLSDLRNIPTGTGTVTSVATGYGLSGGTITTSGTLTADTSVSGLSGKYLRKADTTAILSNYTIGSGSATTMAFWNGTRSLTNNTQIAIDNTVPTSPSLQIRANTGALRSVMNPTYSGTQYDANNYAYSNIATTTPLFIAHEGNINRESRLYSNQIKFTDLTSSNNVTLTPPSSFNNRNYTLPDSSGTIALNEYTVNSISRTAGKDSIIFYVGSTRYAIKDSVGSGSGTGGIPHGTASGTDTYTVTISGVSSYVDGESYLIRFTNGNTTGCTLNINSLGAKTLYRNNDGALIGGDIISGAEMLCIYNSTLDGFQTIGAAPNTLIGYVTNVDSAAITKGQVVYAYGGTGDRMTVKLAKNTSDAFSAQTVGVVASTSIGVNQKGLIIIQGLLDGLSILPTSTFADGDPLFLGATAGSITNVKPSAPNHLVYLGNVTTANNGSAGRWYVRVQNGYELQELHNVAISSPTNNQVLAYSDTSSLWKNRNIYSIVDTTNTIATKTNVALKVNISDTASMLSKYQQKFQGAYSFQANNTNASANTTTQTYVDAAEQNMTNTISWTGTTAPSTLTSANYTWQQIGKTVYLQFNLLYVNAGASITGLFFNLPSDMPTPAVPTGYTGASAYLYTGSASSHNTSATINSNIATSYIRRNSANTAYEVGWIGSSVSPRGFKINITYKAQ